MTDKQYLKTLSTNYTQEELAKYSERKKRYRCYQPHRVRDYKLSELLDDNPLVYRFDNFCWVFPSLSDRVQRWRCITSLRYDIESNKSEKSDVFKFKRYYGSYYLNSVTDKFYFKSIDEELEFDKKYGV